MIVIKRHDFTLGEPTPPKLLQYPDQFDAVFRIDLVRYSIGQLLKASGVKDSVSLSEIDILVGAGHLDVESTNVLVMDMMRLVDEAIRNTGKVKVRYVGDLKESTYGLDAQFFFLGSNATDDDLKEIVFGKLKKGQKKATLINLSNVRDIEVTAGCSDVSDLEKEIKTVQTMASVMDDWRANDFGICVGTV